MKFIYGKNDWSSMERGQENCYLLTNGLGGFSSLTMSGCSARNDHAFLMACLKAPNNRYNMILNLGEKIIAENNIYDLMTAEFLEPQKNTEADTSMKVYFLLKIYLSGYMMLMVWK
ncbi:glycogen debranching enzyme N-terminal domain-containing protein [uncultured Clostridium sp.]|uniref:glycogen debranching enzyme N-terminal domain-containing protein n=1 Tax=uncultured Clostridium sp. TaxID=59620 RepID=UPI0025ED025F|nr:glycogen debranching enzyme N-terminal domain-containing protein [uncultured Clostridium sp.]